MFSICEGLLGSSNEQLYINAEIALLILKYYKNYLML